jgi:KAP-like P-loop domain-containing protein
MRRDRKPILGEARSILSAPVHRVFENLVSPPTAFARPTGDFFHGAYDEFVRAPEYEQMTGFLYLAQVDLERVLGLVATKERPLVVLIDDLDRCAPQTVVQVIEAINLFLAGQYPNAIFVIAMEPEMVAAHVEAAYGELVEKLKAVTSTGRLAWTSAGGSSRRSCNCHSRCPIWSQNE